MRKLTADEIAALKKRAERSGEKIKVPLNRCRVQFVTDAEGVFTTAMVFPNGSNEKVFVGTSKRNRRDASKPEIGELLALRRAVFENAVNLAAE